LIPYLLEYQHYDNRDQDVIDRKSKDHVEEPKILDNYLDIIRNRKYILLDLVLVDLDNNHLDVDQASLSSNLKIQVRLRRRRKIQLDQ